MAIEIRRVDDKIKWGKASAPISPTDKYIVSTGAKSVFVVSPEKNSFTVKSYALNNGKAQGDYEYKGKKFIRLFSNSGSASVVYSEKEPSGSVTYYQANLLPQGFCTDVIALHRTDKDGKIIPFMSEEEKAAYLKSSEIRKAKEKAEAAALAKEKEQQDSKKSKKSAKSASKEKLEDAAASDKSVSLQKSGNSEEK